MAGGKRIRPHLTIVCYGSADDRIIPVAAAQELIHIAMLMHDDIIDQDDMRHGIANINGRYSTHYREYVSPQRAMHYANSAGILAGDCMLSEAYQVISSSSFDASVTRKLINQLHLSIFEVIGGELLDVEASFVQGVDFDPLKIYRYKTASYSFIGPLISGAYCAGTDEREVEKLRTFATNLGIAFQIQDDLLGVFGDEQETGKSSLSDLREGKETLLVRFHRQLMDEEMRERFIEFGNENTSLSALASIRNDMRESGAQQKMTDVAEQYFVAARNNLHQLSRGARYDALTILLDNSSKSGKYTLPSFIIIPKASNLYFKANRSSKSGSKIICVGSPRK